MKQIFMDLSMCWDLLQPPANCWNGCFCWVGLHRFELLAAHLTNPQLLKLLQVKAYPHYNRRCKCSWLLCIYSQYLTKTFIFTCFNSYEVTCLLHKALERFPWRMFKHKNWNHVVCLQWAHRKVKSTLVQALRLCTGCMAHRGSRGIALLFLDHGTIRGWGVSVTPRLLFTPGKDLVPIVQEAGWAPGLVWTVAENLNPTGIRSLDCPACSQSLY
jgi:hypothetical protein